MREQRKAVNHLEVVQIEVKRPSSPPQHFSEKDNHNFVVKIKSITKKKLNNQSKF